ncbi:GerAB/ArcD/ProY family transporter [Brevibacillus sp. SYP-B805]|uniref:GerAB/ArcD/ProY family transporter n=1 Tax=Brevibacillus sp. SYP-B805 TaxID=1578199 RepID=UPI0013ED4972|nr:GerAB/ArcD/ProY family transporter [Brevibacillus sp. SYP-B805]
MKESSNPPVISPLQLVFLIFGTIVGVGFITLPRGVMEKAREDAWISVLLAGIVSILALWLSVRAARLFPQDTLVEYNPKAFGRILGFLFNLAYAGYFFFFTVTGVRTMAEVVRAEMLPFTPLEVIILTMLFAVVYVSWDGLMPIIRLKESGLPLTFLLIVFFLLFAFLEADWSELRVPFVEGIAPVFQALPTTIYSYLGFEILFLYYPFVMRKEKALLGGSIAIALTALFYAFIVLGTLVTIGVDVAIAQTYPVITMAKLIEVVRQFVERGELLLIILWLPLAYTTHIVTLFSTAFTLQRMFPPITLRWWLSGLVPAVFTVSLIPQNLIEMAAWTDKVGVVGLFFSTGYPLLLLLAVWIRRKLHLLPEQDRIGETG